MKDSEYSYHLEETCNKLSSYTGHYKVALVCVNMYVQFIIKMPV